MHSILKNVKIKYSKKVCVHDQTTLTLNAAKDEYLNYEASKNVNLIGNLCVRCHDSERLKSFGVPKRFNSYDDGYVRVTFQEIIPLTESANIKSSVDDEGQLHAYGSGNILPVDISIQMK